MAIGCDIQLILLGESGVGKTSLLLRFVSGTFKEYLPRTRINYSKKVIKIKDKEVNLTVWDTAGQEMYNSLIKSYYRLADGVLLVYDVRNADTFLTLSKWLVDLKSKNENAQVLIAGNKIEDRSKKSVTVSMVSNFARTELLEHVGVSAMSGENVEILFHHLVKKILAARGMLSYSKDRLLEKLEKSGEYLSPTTVILDHFSNLPETQENFQTDNAVPESISESAESQREGIQDPIEDGISSESKGNKPSDAEHTEKEEGSSSQDSDLTYLTVNDESDCDSVEDSESIDSADSALEFFDALEEDVTACLSQNQGDIIKLHEETPRITVQEDKKGCCGI